MRQAGKQQGIGKDEIFVFNVDRGNLMQPWRRSEQSNNGIGWSRSWHI